MDLMDRIRTMDPRIKPEIFGQKTPCADCPFRKDGGARHSIEMMESYIAHFTEMPGSSFPCHKSVPKADDRSGWSEWQDGQVLCVGGLIFAAKQERGNLLTLFGMAQGWYDPSQHSEADRALVFDTPDEMVDAAE